MFNPKWNRPKQKILPIRTLFFSLSLCLLYACESPSNRQNVVINTPGTVPQTTITIPAAAPTTLPVTQPVPQDPTVAPPVTQPLNPVPVAQPVQVPLVMPVTAPIVSPVTQPQSPPPPLPVSNPVNPPSANTEEAIKVTGIKITPPEKNRLQVGNKLQLNAQVTYSDNRSSEQDLEWSSSDPSVATVSTQGEVEALKPGNVNVRVRASKDYSMTSEQSLTIEAAVTPVEKVEIQADKNILDKGSSLQLNAKVTRTDGSLSEGVIWESSDNSIALISTSGMVTYQQPGQVTVTAKSQQDPTKSATFNLKLLGQEENSLGMKFVFRPSGTFVIGSPVSEPDRKDWETQHNVILSSHWMQTTEVTQKQWMAVMGSNPSNFKGDQLPVESVSWLDVQGFINKLNGLGLGKYRLPTESEWEAAARSGTIGSNLPPSSIPWSCGMETCLVSHAVYTSNSGGMTAPVASKNPSTIGLYDMHGNVWEWVQDYEGTYPASGAVDPKGPASGTKRMLRGGAYNSAARTLRSANRGSYAPGDRYSTVGFRLVRVE